MAKTISELRNQSIQVRDASAAGENTATRVGTVLNDIVGHIEDYENTQSSNNSSQDAKIEGVKSSLNTEIARAKTEESNLSNRIDTERTERQAAVSSEETARIQADNVEKTARMAADNAEQDARIQADAAEKTVRENADITLRTMIQTEVSDREKAVAAEAARAKAAEQANAQAIADENARAKAEEQANAQAIADENARAKAEEERLQGEIDNTNDNLNSLDDKVNSNHDHLTDEVARLDLTDNEIKADLEAETARAVAAEDANATDIIKIKESLNLGREKELNVVDAEGNIIATIDKQGLHSVSYELKDNDGQMKQVIDILNDKISKDDETIKYLSDSFLPMNNGELNVVDAEGNIIATIDKQGLHSVSYELKDNDGQMKQVIDILNDKISKDDETIKYLSDSFLPMNNGELNVVDAEGNISFKIDRSGNVDYNKIVNHEVLENAISQITIKSSFPRGHFPADINLCITH